MLSHNLTPLGSSYTVELNYLLLITDLDLSISTQDAQTKFDIEKPMTSNSKVASNSPLLLFLECGVLLDKWFMFAGIVWFVQVRIYLLCRELLDRKLNMAKSNQPYNFCFLSLIYKWCFWCGIKNWFIFYLCAACPISSFTLFLPFLKDHISHFAF